MRYSHCDYILTGATGILGSHVLYELVKMHFEGEINGKIILLSRSSKTLTALQRIERLFDLELIPDYLKVYQIKDILNKLTVINADLKDARDVYERLNLITKDAIFIHMASVVDLGTRESTKWKVFENNYQPTVELLNRCKSIMKKFVFVSTAFASGTRIGLIDDTFLKLDIRNREFRNHYERLKLLTEHEVSKICLNNNVDFQILRPSVICGRLIDPPYLLSPSF